VLLLVLCVGSLRSHVGDAPASELQQQLEQQQRSSAGRTNRLVRMQERVPCLHVCKQRACASLGMCV